MDGKRRDSYSGDMVKRHDEREAKRLLELGLKHFGLVEADLDLCRKGYDRKKVIAWMIRRNTSVWNEWIARALAMGHSSGVSRYVSEVERQRAGYLSKLKQELLIFKD